MPLRLRKQAARAGRVALALAVLPGLLASRRQRLLFQEMRELMGRLPAVLQEPLPAAMTQLTPPEMPQNGPAEATIRRLADVVALLERRSPLGLCLRRSLLRYYYLRRRGVPLAVCFGARMASTAKQRKVAGHAWTTLDGRPYHEEDDNWQNFTVMFRWPG